MCRSTINKRTQLKSVFAEQRSIDLKSLFCGRNVCTPRLLSSLDFHCLCMCGSVYKVQGLLASAASGAGVVVSTQ